MVLEGTNGSLGLVSPMDMWRYKLVGAVVFCYCSEECSACFIVQNVLDGRFVLVGEAGVELVVCLNAMAVMLGPEGPYENCVGLRVECNHDVLVAASSCWCEAPGVICKELIGG